MSLLPSTFRRRSFFALGAVTFTLGLTAHWRSISHGLARPLLFRSQSSFPFTLPPAAPAMAHLRAPQPPPKWDHTAADILALTKEAIANDKEVSDRVAALAPKDCNFTSVFYALAQSDAEFSLATQTLAFYQNVSPAPAVRDASNAAEVLVEEYAVESSMRTDVFRAKEAAAAALAAAPPLSPEEQRMVEKTMLAGRRAGLALPDAQRERLKALKKELSQACLQFGKNFNEEHGVVSFTRAELEGVPADVMSGYTKRTEGAHEVFDVPFRTTDIFPVFKYAVNPETRHRAHDAYESRLAPNVPLLARALALRRQIAALLGYATWADYATEPKMVKTGAGVAAFLDDLEARLRPLALAERAALLALKEAEHAARGLPFDGEFYIWDYRYYDRLHLERTLQLDDALVKQYFPVTVVVPTILDIYQNLLGVRFVPLQGATAWHEDVQQFAVWEKDATDERGFIGYCYLDLFPRPSKYSHAAVFPVVMGFERPDGSRNYPVACMVANLAKPTPDAPALMRHDDVVTFFHEMGHVFHGLLSRTKFMMFHGTSVARDFVEAPSQMLEYWCWEPKVLAMMSSHYQTKAPLSPELIEKIVKSRYVNVGLFYLRQLFFANFDLKVHTDPEAADYSALWSSMREKISLVKGGAVTPGQGTFGHITSGYDAGYYGYTYSLVFAADMYATVFKKDPLDPALGKHYRESILLPGGSREEADSLEAFLGRPSNTDAFLQDLFGQKSDSHL